MREWVSSVSLFQGRLFRRGVTQGRSSRYTELTRWIWEGAFWVEGKNLASLECWTLVSVPSQDSRRQDNFSSSICYMWNFRYFSQSLQRLGFLICKMKIVIRAQKLPWIEADAWTHPRNDIFFIIVLQLSPTLRQVRGSVERQSKTNPTEP